MIVVAEPNSNSLLISATPRYFEDIQEMITRIDAAKPEVVIQALLVEVTLDNTDEFGIELGFQDKLLFNRSLTAPEDITTITTTNQPTTVGGTTTTSQTIISQAATPGFLFNSPTLGNNVGSPNASPGTVAGQSLSNFAVGRTNGNLGFGGLVLSAGSESVNVLLRLVRHTQAGNPQPSANSHARQSTRHNQRRSDRARCQRHHLERHCGAVCSTNYPRSVGHCVGSHAANHTG